MSYISPLITSMFFHYQDGRKFGLENRHQEISWLKTTPKRVRTYAVSLKVPLDKEDLGG